MQSLAGVGAIYFVERYNMDIIGKLVGHLLEVWTLESTLFI